MWQNVDLFNYWMRTCQICVNDYIYTNLNDRARDNLQLQGSLSSCKMQKKKNIFACTEKNENYACTCIINLPSCPFRYVFV